MPFEALKGQRVLPPLSVLVSFFGQKTLITLQRIQVSSILSWAVIVGLAISRLPPFGDTPLMATDKDRLS